MTGRLREELARLGDHAPVAAIDPDTWARARRARLRDRSLLVAAAVAVIALLGGVALLPGPDHPAPAPLANSGAAPGVPGQIWGVPARLTMKASDGSWSSDLVETDLVVGRGAAAYVTEAGLPVVISAADGAYHLLDLPGFLGNSDLSRGRQVGYALSPDGRRLAYAWAGPAPASDATPMPSGVRVLDLANGDVRTVRLSQGRGVMVDHLTWSPDSRWLAWQGRVATYWTASSSAYRHLAIGRIAPGAETSQEVPATDGSVVATVDDDGAVSLLTTGRVTTWDGRPLSSVRLRGARPVTAAARQPSGNLAIVGSSSRFDAITSVDVRTGAVVAHRFLGGLYPGGADSVPLGWVDDGLLVALVTPRESADGAAAERQVVVTTPQRGPGSTYRIVGHVDAEVPESLSVAVDLMTLARPTVERPEPDWPWSDERRAVVIGASALGLLLLAGGLVVLRRRNG